MMQCWKFWNHSQCPRCGEENEDVPHVFACIGHDTDDRWTANIKALREWLEDRDTDPDLTEALCEHLLGWRANIEVNKDHYPDELRALIEQQQQLGWLPFVHGWLVKEWAAYQHQYFQELGLR